MTCLEPHPDMPGILCERPKEHAGVHASGHVKRGGAYEPALTWEKTNGTKNILITPEMIEEARRLVRRRYGDGLRAWLVGSRITGKYGPDSDLDVIIECAPRYVDAGEHMYGLRIEGESGVEFHLFGDEDGPIGTDAVRIL